jgi:hypothetical protein
MLNSRKALSLSALVVLVSSCTPSAPTGPAQPAPSATPVDAQRIADIAAGSACARHDWTGRGRPAIGYIKGMALAYAKSFCEVRRDAGGAAPVIAGPLQSTPNDALDHYGIGGVTSIDRLRATYTLLIGLGMRESSGKTTEGRDTTVRHPTAENAEAGLFQVSHDSINVHPVLRQLQSDYAQHPEACALSAFMEGLGGRPQPDVGTGAGAEFQSFTKACPAFAAEYAGVMIRVDATHFGPINRKEAEFEPSCQAMLQEVEQATGCE